MSGNSYLDLICSNLDSYYALTDYGWAETPGATSQAGVYDCSNGAGAPSSNTRSDESRMPYSVADGTSSHSGVMRFHQEQPCNPGLPGSAVLIGGSPRPENHSQNHAVVNGSASLSQRALSEDAYATDFHQEQPCNPGLPGSAVLIGGSPRPENHSQNHAVVNGSASLSQRALSEDAYATDFHQEQPCNPGLPGSAADNLLLIGNSPRPESHSQNHAVVNGSASLSQRALSEDAYATEAVISQKKSITISVYISEREGELIDKEMVKGHFFSRAEFARHCVNRYTESNYGIKIFKCPADSPVNGSSFLFRFTLPKDACEAEAEKTKKRKTDTEPAGGKKRKRIAVNLTIKVTHCELTEIDRIMSKRKFFSRSEFHKYCINLYWINKYGEKLFDYPGSDAALAKLAAFTETVNALKQKDEAAINKITTREEKIKALEEKIKALEEKNNQQMNYIITLQSQNRSNPSLTYGAHSDLPQYIGCYDPAADKMTEDAAAALAEVQAKINTLSAHKPN